MSPMSARLRLTIAITMTLAALVFLLQLWVSRGLA